MTSLDVINVQKLIKSGRDNISCLTDALIMVVVWMKCVNNKTVSSGSNMLTESALAHITSISTRRAAAAAAAAEDDVETEAVERRFVETQLGT